MSAGQLTAAEQIMVHGEVLLMITVDVRGWGFAFSIRNPWPGQSRAAPADHQVDGPAL